MPEGPEVRKVTAALNDFAQNKMAKSVNILGGRFEKTPPKNIDLFEGPLKINAVRNKGKFIWFEFDNGLTMWNTLGMSGCWALKKHNHSHFEIELPDASLYFVDQRRFGTIKFTDSKDELEKKLSTLGPDPIQENFSVTVTMDRYSKFSKKTICEAMMNQQAVSGIGNYLKAEILYRAKVSPLRKVSDISEHEWMAIHEITRRIMRLSLSQGGASLRNYKDLNEKEGVFTLHVYRQSQDPSGREVIATETPDRRTTWWVPSVQN